MNFPENEVAAFHTIEFDSFNQVFHDLSEIGNELTTLATDTQQDIATCNTLATTSEVNACYDPISEELKVYRDDILNRISELYELGNSALQISEDNMQEFKAGNRQFVRESSQVTRSELTRCIQSM